MISLCHMPLQNGVRATQIVVLKEHVQSTGKNYGVNGVGDFQLSVGDPYRAMFCLVFFRFKVIIFERLKFLICVLLSFRFLFRS